MKLIRAKKNPLSDEEKRVVIEFIEGSTTNG